MHILRVGGQDIALHQLSAVTGGTALPLLSKPSDPQVVSGPYSTQQSAISLVLAAILSWFVFLVLYLEIFPFVGETAAILNLLMLAGLAWYGGMKYGLLQAIISILTVPFIMTKFSSVPFPSIGALLFILFISLALTALVGHLRDVRLQLIISQQRLIQVQENLRFQAEHDALTGLNNRRFFNQQLYLAHTMSQRYDQPLSVVLLDIDHFKQVNDLYSHSVGDQVLQEIGRILLDGVREVDSVARYGCEEFVLCLPSTSMDGALKLCERLRVSIATHNWEKIQMGLRVTVSGGVFSGPPLGSPEQMLSVADHRLYMAKEAGRNRIQFTDAVGTLN